MFGHGPALTLLKPHPEPRDYEFAPWLAARYTVFQIEPLGYARSDRPARYPQRGIHEQVHAVLDQEGIARSVVWGYSKGGAMALAVAQASPRVTAVVCGGWSPAERHSEARLRRMEREERPPVAARTFWRWYSGFNWLDELALMQLPKVVYVGTEDTPRVRGPRGVPRTREALIERGVNLLELEGLDHEACMREPAVSTRVGPAIIERLDHPLRIG